MHFLLTLVVYLTFILNVCQLLQAFRVPASSVGQFSALKWRILESQTVRLHDAKQTLWDRLQNTVGRSKSTKIGADNSDYVLNSDDVPSVDVLIVGAGISGLSCAVTYQKIAPKSTFLLLEASSTAGGRVGSDNVDGFILDKGFQVFIDSYPEAKGLLDYKDLLLQRFLPGAKVRMAGEFYIVSDPIRRPQDLVPSLLSPIGSLLDKIKVGIFSLLVRGRTMEEIYSRDDQTTKEFLSKALGLSDLMINTFFRPFYQGIFLSPIELQSSRMFEWLFKMFSEGSATLPLQGMQAIPDQLVARLPSDRVKLNHSVQQLQRLSNGDYAVTYRSDGRRIGTLRAKQIVIAADPVNAKKLYDTAKIGGSELVTSKTDELKIPDARGSTCLYFAIDGLPPIREPILVLNGENLITDKDDVYPVAINNVCFPNLVSPAYAPPGKSLASITVVGTPDQDIVSEEMLIGSVRSQLQEWWGDSVLKWKLLRIYRIPYAQPAQISPYTVGDGGQLEVRPGLFVIGDHRISPTLHGAISSGRLAAEQLFTSKMSFDTEKGNRLGLSTT